MKNVFKRVKVLAILHAGENADILELKDIETGKIVLEVGTDRSDDYYPSFVAYFMPENMVLNQKSGT